MNESRLLFETAILKRNFANRFLFTKEGRKDVLLVGLKSQSGNVYQIKIELSEIYPIEMPTVFIVYPKGLKNFNGKRLPAFNHEMHTLASDANKVQVCHFLPGNWNPMQSLYKVILKVKIWLEAYEFYLKTSKPISDYLKK
jgi:ubiquitin-protein ligase